jgi:type VI secretion system Hcp family effector
MIVGLLAIGVFCASTAHAIDAALTLASSGHGAIEGDNLIAGRVGTIVVQAYADALVTPTGTNGTPTGSPACRPLMIRKPLDKATPVLAAAWNSLDTMTTFVLRFYGKSGNATVNTSTIQLTNARIIAISRAGGSDDASPSEQVTFGFTSAVYTNETNSVVATISCMASPV